MKQYINKDKSILETIIYIFLSSAYIYDTNDDNVGIKKANFSVVNV